MKRYGDLIKEAQQLYQEIDMVPLPIKGYGSFAEKERKEAYQERGTILIKR